MPPFSGHSVDIYTSIEEEESPPPSPTVSQTIYRTFRRSLLLDGNFEACPGVQPLGARPPKNVTFNLERNKTHAVLHKTEYSAQEKSCTWISLEELKQIKANSKSIVQAWHSGAEWYCMRGLEAKQSEAYRLKRKQNKADIRFAVMQEQSKQKFATGEIDHDKLAKVSQNCSELSRIEAEQVGQADAQAAAACNVMDVCHQEAQAELMGYDSCANLFLLAQSAYAY